jgi:hypothetical protein
VIEFIPTTCTIFNLPLVGHTEYDADIDEDILEERSQPPPKKRNRNTRNIEDGAGVNYRKRQKQG